MVLCNGECGGITDFGATGQKAVAALVGGGAEPPGSSLCSSLSITACPLRNAGAMAVAKALCQRRVLAPFPKAASSLDNVGRGAIGSFTKE